MFLADPGTGGGLMAISASTGQIQWYSPDGHRHPVIGGRPAVRDGTVYVVGTANSGYVGLFGYDVETGDQTFSFTSSDYMLGSVTAAPDVLVVGSRNDDVLVGLDDTETIRWEYNPDELQLIREAFAVANGVAYALFGRERTNLVAVDTTDGTELWRRSCVA